MIKIWTVDIDGYTYDDKIYNDAEKKSSVR